MSSGGRLDDLPGEVRALLEERVKGLEHLELLLLMCREAGRSWSASEAAAKLSVSMDQLQDALTDLHASQLVMPTADSRGSFRFHPSTPALRATCIELLRLYDADRFAIVLAMGQLAMERVRRSAARAFADAFRIRKPPGGGDSDA